MPVNRLVRTVRRQVREIRVGDVVKVCGGVYQIIDVRQHGDARWLTLDDRNNLRYSHDQRLEVTRAYHSEQDLVLDAHAHGEERDLRVR